MVYEPYGKIRHNYKSGSYGNDYTFTGKELDSETSLQYFGARYYSGIAGKFTSSDPIFLALGSGSLNGLRDPQVYNSYAYGRNNPYRMVDPDGQMFLNTVGNFVLGVLNAIASNNMLGYGRIESSSSGFGAGQTTGDVISFGQGIVEAAAGVIAVAGGTTGGVITSPTGVGVIAGAGVSAGGIVAVGHGYGVGTTAAQNLFADLGSGGGRKTDVPMRGDQINGAGVTDHAARRASQRGMTTQQIEHALTNGTRYLDTSKSDSLLITVGEKGNGGYSIVTTTDMKTIQTVQDFIPNLSSNNGTRFMQVAR